MAAADFERALALVLVHEGGYVDHPADSGDATNLGVTIGTLADWPGRPATKAEVKALTKATVAPIYRRNYWNAVRGDELPFGVDFCVFDVAVNSGKGRAIPSLQRAFSVVDGGKIGPLTLSAAADNFGISFVTVATASGGGAGAGAVVAYLEVPVQFRYVRLVYAPGANAAVIEGTLSLHTA